MTRKDKRKLTVRVPNPKAPVKGRLKTPPHQVHKSAKQYRRREKHPAFGDLTLPEWLQFHVRHCAHHAKQIRARLAS